MRTGVVLIAVAIALGALCAPDSRASQILDRNVTTVRLAVNAKDEALVTYTRANGQTRRVLAWAAVDAVASDPSVPQQRFKLDYTGGWGKYRKSGYWRTFKNVCRPYTGPPLAYGLTACTAPDGSHWALQSWQRVQPLRGVAPFLPEHMAWELHLSHWTTALAVLEVSPNWTYDGTLQGLFGRMLYDGKPVYGSKTPARGRADRNARYVYIDTFNSAYGPGWKRDGAKVTHVGSGGFCYSFAPLVRPPPGYPSVPTVSGKGERHRVSAMGPGVTPDIVWEGAALGPYDPVADRTFNALFDSILGADKVCTGER
jgi:uncharacterized protein YbaA (DUF1428 family)